MKAACLMLAALLAPLLAPRAAGYAIVATRAIEAPTIAEIFIEEGRIRVEAEIGPGEAALWRRLRITLPGGTPLEPRLLERSERPKVRRDEVTGEPLAPGDSPAEMITYAVFEYPLAGRPAKLRFSGPRIGFIVYHLGLPVIDLHYLEGEAELALDWRDPWNSRFASARLRRLYDARAAVFLYVEPYEVRVEILARPVDLVWWPEEAIPVARQQELKERAAALLGDSCRLTVDGAATPLRLDRVHFLQRRLWTSTVVDPPEELAAASATLGAIFVAPVRGFPREVTLEWRRFTPPLDRLAAAVADEAGARPAMLRPDSNTLRWENLGRYVAAPALVPVAAPPGRFAWLWPFVGAALLAALGLTLAVTARRLRRGRSPSRADLAASFLLLVASGAAFTAARSARLDPQQTAAILHGLLFNIYRAFDYRDEETVYDLLATSVAGDLLREVYLEARSALELRNQGGARAKVKQVEIVRVESRPLRGEAGFRARAVWNVAASVAHWGHIHQRVNRYEAVLTVKDLGGAWRITGMEIAGHERLR